MIGAGLSLRMFLIFACTNCARDFVRRAFGRYLVVGVTTMIGAGILQHQRGACTAALPKGIPLPPISYGGSSLFVMLASVDGLLNVSQQT
jgi:cell division protein FtsW